MIDTYIRALEQREKDRQRTTINLIASENYPSEQVRALLDSSFISKYAEGYPGARYYGGCGVVDTLETAAQDLWLKVFKAPNYAVNVQPLSGTHANLAAYGAILKPGDTILAMSSKAGGHLSHSSPANTVSKFYNVISYGVANSGFLDMEEVRNLALEHKPKLIVCGASAYPRRIPFDHFKEIADEVGAFLMADISHIAGLIAGEAHDSPFGYADIITTTTQKTLRGVRGGLIFSKSILSDKINRGVFPNIAGGPHMNIIAANAVAAEEALDPSFKGYIQSVVSNAKVLASTLKMEGAKLLTNGTDNHLIVMDTLNFGLSGIEAQNLLEKNAIVCNKEWLPYDTSSPTVCSGIRFGTAAMTSRGYKKEDFQKVGRSIVEILKAKI